MAETNSAAAVNNLKERKEVLIDYDKDCKALREGNTIINTKNLYGMLLTLIILGSNFNY